MSGRGIASVAASTFHGGVAMTLADLVAHRTGSAAALEQDAGEDTLLALHHAMNRVLDSAGRDFGSAAPSAAT